MALQKQRLLLVLVVTLVTLTTLTLVSAGEADATAQPDVKLDADIGKSREGSKTDDEAVQREEEAIKLDGLSVAQMKELKESSEKHIFQAEVDRMMKLIINSLYKNKEIYLRELISNASDALDKIRFLSLTDPNALGSNEELSIRIKADKENHVLHVTDTGIGMTKDDLVKNLGTIAKSGTSEFLQKMGEGASGQDASDLIGQFGVGFYSSFLVADRVIVTSKHNDDEQHIWESDAASFSVVKDPRGNTLGRGTTISLFLKEEAHDNLEQARIKELVKKYSQFINFPIYLWDSKTEKVEEVDDEEEEEKKPETKDDDEDGTVEEEEEKKPKKKEVEKTVWDWVLVNENKPLWTKKPADVTEDEYNEFYKSFSKDSDNPMAKTHFTAEGEVTFKSILFIPKTSPADMFQNYGKKMDSIKMFVRRVFITDNFEDMMPKYLSFVRGVVDSDDLPLNVSRETLQQHKLLKVIKKKLVRKTLDMIKKISDEDFKTFWKEYSTNIKLGVMEDHSNRTRLAKLLRFYSSNSDTEVTSLAEYVERMKEKQEHIYFIAGSSRAEVEKSPFVERLLKKGYEVLYLVEAIDEYCIQSLPEFEGKKFQNAGKEGVKLDSSEKAKQRKEATEKEFEPLLAWMKDDALKDKIEKAVITERLTTSPCALVASSFGWSGNMERIMKAQAYQKANDPNNQFYATQKKTLELNARHPLVKELKRRVEDSKDDQTTKDLAVVLFETATLRSGFSLPDTADFAGRVERMLRLSMDISLDEKIDEEPEEEEEEEAAEEEKDADDDEDDDEDDNASDQSAKAETETTQKTTDHGGEL
jgi:heat shock protein beta